MTVSPRTTVIEPGDIKSHYWRDIWRFRDLFLILAWRDLAVRYKQTLIGIGWALIRPLLTMVVFTVVFGGLAKLPSAAGVPYALLVLAGLLPWFLFSSILSDASNSLVANANLVGKIYFPRIIVPAASGVTSLVDFAINLLVLFIVIAFFRHSISINIVLLPVVIFFTCITALGPALIMAALNVKYRDFRFVVPFVVQFGLYVSPVGFSSQLVPQEWQLLYWLNPVVLAIEAFRWTLSAGNSEIPIAGLLMSVTISALMLAGGLIYFRRTEREFADVI